MTLISKKEEEESWRRVLRMSSKGGDIKLSWRKKKPI